MTDNVGSHSLSVVLSCLVLSESGEWDTEAAMTGCGCVSVTRQCVQEHIRETRDPWSKYP